jgi:hypothetical protein
MDTGLYSLQAIFASLASFDWLPLAVYTAVMTDKMLKDVLERVEAWPEEAQRELAEIALEIDAELTGGVYHATPDELRGIDRGLRAAGEGRFASDAEVKAVLAKHRRA